jgi:mannan endo-1,4-beta-mannosidase
MTVMPPEAGGPRRGQSVTSHRDVSVDAASYRPAARAGTFVQRIVGPLQRNAALAAAASIAAAIVVAAVTAVTIQKVVPEHLPTTGASAPGGSFRLHPVVITLPARPASYLGVYADGVPRSYEPVESFAATTGAHPNIALYYSGWNEPFQTSFATQAANHGAVPLVQIEPGNVSLAAIAAGNYDAYLESYANAVASFGARTGRGVIIGFAHEPNGTWYRWGFRHVAPATWIAAWRHVVNVFRRQGADNVTWLWTVNIIDIPGGIPSPARWWPGSSYVTWVGIDGYYYKPSWEFPPLFGPTIKAVRALTLAPILISETGAAPAAGQPAKVADIFAGIHAYGLLGLVWFDADRSRDWRLTSREAIAAYTRGAKTFNGPAP